MKALYVADQILLSITSITIKGKDEMWFGFRKFVIFKTETNFFQRKSSPIFVDDSNICKN